MPEILNSKKLILSLLGVILVFVLAMVSKDIELIKWVGGFVTGIVSTMNVAQGFADGISRGRTSASAKAARAGNASAPASKACQTK
ncbi:MAG: hypothetical protein ACYTF6_11990 [Planctomycetota bacterium]|jgi:hypothetical protein